MVEVTQINIKASLDVVQGNDTAVCSASCEERYFASCRKFDLDAKLMLAIMSKMMYTLKEILTIVCTSWIEPGLTAKV